MTSPITTHILDTRLGKPAHDVRVQLFTGDTNNWQEIASARTNSDGRILDLLDTAQFNSGHYQLRFDTAEYFEQQGVPYFYPSVTIEFNIREPGQHYHVPLLLTPFGYSTYRGS